MEMYRKNSKKICCCVSSAMMLTQAFAGAFYVQAEELEFDGVTQITADSYYLDVDTFAVELEVAEVYAEAGTQISQGDQILKLTEDSYQEAVDYYTAALIRAENNLTDVQLEYDQGVLESQYTYETAKAKAELAELVKEYQETELADTIAAHEEILEEIDDRIAELEAWTGTSSGSSSGGGSSAGSSQQSRGDAEQESELEDQKTPEQESESQTENPEQNQTSDSLEESEGQSEDSSVQKPETAETDAADTELAETEPTETKPMESTETNPAETESAGSQESETQPESGEPGKDTAQDATDKQQQMDLLKIQIEEKNQAGQEIIKQIEALGMNLTGEADGKEETDANQEAEENGNQVSSDDLQSSIDGNTNVKTNLENVQKNLQDVPDDVMSIVKLAYPDYEEYVKLLADCIQQLNADIETQEQVKKALSSQEGSDSSKIDEEKLQTLLTELVKTGEEKSELYTQLITLQAESIEELQKQAEEQAEQEKQTEETQTESTTQPEQPSQSEQTEMPTQSEPGANEYPEETNQTPESEKQSESGLWPETGTPSGTVLGQESEGQSEMTQTRETEQQPESDSRSGSGDSPVQDENASGESSESGRSSGGMSMPSGSMGGSGSSGSGTADISSGSFSQSGSGSLQSAGNMTLSEDEISLFGSTYDLTQVENLLEREPLDSDSAQELAEQLEDSRKTVQSQYEELLREQKITELGIQYTYDTSVLSGKLAEFTYQEEMQEWEETLSEAKAEKTDLESQKTFLENMTDGILTADWDGMVSEVSYEEGDTINSMTSIISYYDMDTVTIVIEVPQEDIGKIQVGDTVEVTIGGRMSREGTVAEKAAEPESGTSRTTVNYQVTIELDNTDQLLTAGLSASVTVSQEQETAVSEEDGEDH